MAEKDSISKKLGELIKVCTEFKTLSDTFEKELDYKRKEASSFETAIANAKESYDNTVKSMRTYREDFEANNAKERKQIESDRAEAKRLLSEAEDKLVQVRMSLDSAQRKEESAKAALEQAEKSKKEWEEKRNKVRDFLKESN